MTYWIVAGIAAFLLGMSKGGVPMIALLSVPLMALYMDPVAAAGLLLPIYVVADAYAIYLFRKSFSLRVLKIMLPGAAAGIILGFFTVSHVPGDPVKLLVAAIGFYYLTHALKNRLRKTPVPPRPADVPRGMFWGTVAGLTSYISHAGGPPFQNYVLPLKLDKMVFLGTTAIFFSVVNMLKVPPYILAGQITWESAAEAAWLAPVTIAGAWTGVSIARMLPERIFFALIEIMLAVVSIKLVWEVFAG